MCPKGQSTICVAVCVCLLLALLLLGQEGRTLGPTLPHIALAVKTHHHFSSAPVLAQALEAHKRKCRRTAGYVWI